VKKKWSKWP